MESKNDIFDFGRFGRELKHYCRDRRRELTLLPLSAIVIVALFTFGNLGAPARNIDIWNFTIIFYFIILSLCVSVAARAFSDLNTTNGMLGELTTPASQSEKFLARWVVSIPLPLIFSLALMKVIEKVGTYAMKSYMITRWPDMAESYAEIFALSASWIVSLVWLQAIFFTASAAWRKHSTLKAIASLALAAILAMCIWGNYMPWLNIAYNRIALLICLGAVPLGYYIAAWVMYRRAQVK